jgi:hypothetical protein
VAIFLCRKQKAPERAVRSCHLVAPQAIAELEAATGLSLR